MADPSSDLFFAQPITFQSMLNARQNARHAVQVELLSAQYAGDIVMVPQGFKATRNLQQSVLDVAVFEHQVRLPLLAEILDRLYHESDADYLIYTNVDIGLFPDFYLRVNDFIHQGHDAFIINRRRLRDKYKQVAELDLIYEEKGKSHPGFDCFVFHRSIYPKLQLANICIGVPFIEISFSQNLFAFARHFKLYDNERLTFHLGMEVFKKRMPDEYFRYNRQQFKKIIPLLFQYMSLHRFPYATRIWPLRMLTWAFHPCIPIKLVLKLQINDWKAFLFKKKSRN